MAEADEHADARLPPDPSRAAPGDPAPAGDRKGDAPLDRYNAYAFEVNRLATKDDVRRAVEELFGVKVVRVHTVNRKGKPRRTRFRSGYTKDWKKAIVKLRSESTASTSSRDAMPCKRPVNEHAGQV